MKNGFSGALTWASQDQLDRLVGQVLAEVVALLGLARLADRGVVLGQVRIPLVGLTAEEPVEAFEPPT
jgi:hypothetical protein